MHLLFKQSVFIKHVAAAAAAVVVVVVVIQEY